MRAKRVNSKIIVVASTVLVLFGCARARVTKNQNSNELLNDFGGSSAQSNKTSQNASSNSQPSANVDDFSRQSGVAPSDLLAVSAALKSRSESQLIKVASGILSRNPDQLQTLNALAVYYYESHQYGMSVIILNRALKSHPNAPALYNNLGVVFLAQGKTQKAIDAFKKSLQLKSDYQTGATNLSTIYLEYHDYSRGLAVLEQSYDDTQSKLEQGDPNAVSIANNYAVALMGLGEYSKAKRIFSRIMKSNQQNPVPLLNYAILLVEVLKQKNDAIEVISKLKFMTEDRRILQRVLELEQQLESQQ